MNTGKHPDSKMTPGMELDAHELIQNLWHHTTIDSYSQFGSDSPDTSSLFAAYKDYYQRQWCLMAGHDGNYALFKTPSELNEFIRHVSATESPTWEDLTSHLKNTLSRPSTDENISHTLDLALSLLLMVKFGPTIGEARPCHYPQWTSGCLKICLRSRFSREPTLDISGVRLSRDFNAWSLKAIGGMEIGFTDNLDDHLLLVEKAKGMKVLVSHQVSFLECHTRYSRSPSVLFGGLGSNC